MNRRNFIKLAASLGATLTWRNTFASKSKVLWREHRDLYPQGVASGDPHHDSVLLWTRRPPVQGSEARHLTVEVADDINFERVVLTGRAEVSGETDWTCRMLAAGLKPRRVYWYRFTDEHGFGSRIGRTITAPHHYDDRPVAFAFVSCQNVQQGASNAYRRMIWEDERQNADQQLGFVLHLGDFVYEIVWYPEDRPQGMYDRRLRDIVRYPDGEKFNDLHYALTLEDYRVLYRAYLMDPDLQDARARWPFVCVWDNHEFSWKGWQSQQDIGGVRPAQKTKVAANQAWFEYQPARVVKQGNPASDRFEAPPVENVPLTEFDEYGLGLESGNLTAIRSLKINRALRYGRNVELILTDNHSFRSQLVSHQPESKVFEPKEIPFFFPQDVLEILDAGRTCNGGLPPETIRFDGKEIPNPRKDEPAQSMLGFDQKKWFLESLRNSNARWKLWGNSTGALDCRLDLQNLPSDLGVRWPANGYGILGEDWSAYRCERAEILNFVKRMHITGFVSIAGDRHSFFAGLLSAALPPLNFEPVAAEFITGSISAPGLVEALSYRMAKNDPIQPIFLQESTTGARVLPAINLSVTHGVRSSLAHARTRDNKLVLEEQNKELSPHLSFVDLGGHGYSVVYARDDALEVEFVCIPRPFERSDRSDGGPLLYRIRHRLNLWDTNERPELERSKVEGELPLGSVKQL